MTKSNGRNKKLDKSEMKKTKGGLVAFNFKTPGGEKIGPASASKTPGGEKI